MKLTSILYLGAANSHLYHLDDLRSQIEWICSFVFQPPSHHQNTVFIRIKAGLIYTQGLKHTPGSAAE